MNRWGRIWGRVWILSVLILCTVLLLSACGQKTDTSNIGSEEEEILMVFPDGTQYCGVDLSGKAVEEAITALQSVADEYSVEVTLDGQSFTMSGKQLGLVIDTSVEWDTSTDISQLSLFRTANQEAIEKALIDAYSLAVDTPTDKSDGALNNKSNNTSKVSEKPEEPVRDSSKASIRYDESKACFIGVDGAAGYSKEYSEAAEKLSAGAALLESSIVLQSTQKKSDGEKAADSSVCQKALKEANSYLSIDLSYTFSPKGGESASVPVSPAEIASWLIVKSDGLSVELDTNSITAYVSALAQAHSISGSNSAKFKTTSGGTLDINLPSQGETVDTDALYIDLLECLTEKKSGTREAPYIRQSETDDGQFGGNYIEIDLTNQMVYLYKNGSLLVSSACVTGNVWEGHATPTGVYSVFSMETDTYLEGVDYRSYVNYFMPFNGGIGLHDASWRYCFGGDIYLYDGSHGCINMPYSAVKTIYDNIYCGYKVIVYGGVFSVEKVSPSWSGKTSYEVSEGESPFSLNIKTDSDGALSYSSSNSGVAKVDTKGKVTITGPGSAVIKVSVAASDKYTSSSTSVSVTVKSKSVSQSISAPDSLTLQAGEAKSINATAATSLSYSTSDSSVVSVTSDGIITGISAGNADITIRAAEEKGYLPATLTVRVTVTEKERASQNLSLTIGESSLEVGQTTIINVSGACTDCTFISNDTSVVTVDMDGTVQAVGAGTAVISVVAEETTEYKGATTGIQVSVLSSPEPDGPITDSFSDSEIS